MKIKAFHLNEKAVSALLILFFVVLAFIHTGDTREFRPDDESLYVQIAKEMYEKGEMWIPTWFGEHAFYKPPLTYWISMLGFLAHGVSLGSARIPIALITLLTVLLTWLIAKDLFGKREGILAAILTATSLGFVIYGKVAMMDLPLCFLITLGVYCFHRAATKPVWIAAFFAVSGISTLIKGPVSFIILMVFALSCCLVTGKWHMLFNRWTPAGIFLAVAGIALWPLAVYLRGAWKEWFDFFIIGENVGKFHEKIHYPGYRITGYFLQYLIPWSPLFLMSLWVWLKTKSYRKYETVSPFIWMLAIVIIHLLPETKLKHYVIPAIPPAAILIASCAEVKEPAMRAGKILTQVFLGLILLGTLGLFRLTEGWTNLLFIGLALILLCYSISAAHRDVNACALSYGCSLILLIAAISSLTFYRLPGDGLACTKGHRVAVIRLQSYLYSYDVGSFTPQLTNAVDFNLFLLDGGRIIISESDLREFSTIKGFKLVPVVRLYTWKQWKKSLPLEKIISVLWSGNKRELIEEMYIVEKSPDF